MTLPEGERGTTHLGVTVSPLFDERGAAARRHLPLHGLDRGEGPRGTAAAQGKPRHGGRADRRHRARVQKRAGDDSRLQQAVRPQRAARVSTGRMSRASVPRPKSLGEVVTNFLNFARPAQLTLSRVDLRAICERAAEEVRAEARTLGGDVDVRGEFGAIEGDEVLLRQAFSNLLRNAVEACAAASVAPVVVIRLRARSAAAVSPHHGRRQRPGHRPGGARAHLPAVLHDQAQRHRPWPRAGAEDHRLPQRPHRRSVTRRSAAPACRFLYPP